jgi:hypothetical protein
VIFYRMQSLCKQATGLQFVVMGSCRHHEAGGCRQGQSLEVMMKTLSV